ncbi:Rid family detoxifying hydrolase [Thermococcus waiotapuensis]|uniref:Rid family detoxifying hydrolase n=1 Tax=Thermococcus waiotapuensis TaxID=90909 RepID=A0AAE4NVK2_9EURY|nr:Rid family detoxifying hydrolase [Thermococcus waiotapuensis]MDV3104037.1 Rid family detoxifying hydrolase [Thermococcus waiotapuensis]
MEKQIVIPPGAPSPIGPYSPGILASGRLLFVSGQIPVDPATGKLVEGSFEEKVRQTLRNLLSVVEGAGGSAENVVKVTVYLRDIGKYDEFNRVYSEFFSESKPVRAVVEVSNLPRGVDIEVEAIAVF